MKEGKRWRDSNTMTTSDTKSPRKPLTLDLVAAGYLGMMVLSVVQIYSQGRSIYPHDILFMIFYPVVAYGIFKMKRWAWSLIIGHIIFLVVGNIILAMKDGYFDNLLFVQFNLLLLFFLWFFLRTNVRSPFHNPALRWWERQHARFGATFQVTLRNESGNTIKVDGINVSKGGCFVKLANDQDIAHNERFEVELRYEDFEPFRTRGRAMWVAGASELNPKGAGIIFSRPDRANRLVLKEIMKEIESRWLKSAEGAPAL